MFVSSEELKKRIEEISTEIFQISKGAISFEEYIALPFYGSICLRFNLNLEEYTVDALDFYEKLIYEIVKDEFIVDFMGDVYRKVVDYQHFDEMLARMANRYQNEEIIESTYAERIRLDARCLLRECGIDAELDVWEIQPDEEIWLLLLGDERKQLGTYHIEDKVIHVWEENRTLCEGLLKATFYAKRNHISLVRTMLELD